MIVMAIVNEAIFIDEIAARIKETKKYIDILNEKYPAQTDEEFKVLSKDKQDIYATANRLIVNYLEGLLKNNRLLESLMVLKFAGIEMRFVLDDHGRPEMIHIEEFQRRMKILDFMEKAGKDVRNNKANPNNNRTFS